MRIAHVHTGLKLLAACCALAGIASPAHAALNVGSFGLSIDSSAQGWHGENISIPTVVTRSSAVGGTDANGVFWTQAGFDDSAWSAARFNYPIASATPTTWLPSADRPAYYMWHDPNGTSDGTTGVTTAYFRTTFTLPVFPQGYSARLRVRADDDFAVMLNGFLVSMGPTQDYGTIFDQGADHVFETGIMDFMLNTGGANVLAIQATDGAYGNPSDVIYEHLAFELRLNEQVPEPISISLALVALAGAGLARRSRNPA